MSRIRTPQGKIALALAAAEAGQLGGLSASWRRAPTMKDASTTLLAPFRYFTRPQLLSRL